MKMTYLFVRTMILGKSTLHNQIDFQCLFDELCRGPFQQNQSVVFRKPPVIIRSN